VAHPAEGSRIDHIFVFVEPGGEEEAGRLAASGPAESCRRHHPGQGTANACCCFDDFYLELFRATGSAELVAPAVAPTWLLSLPDCDPA
jgi:Glyoxalase-like domain